MIDMTLLLYGFASLRAGSALKLAINMPAPVRELEPFLADDTESVDGVSFLHLMELLAFHDLLLEKNWRGMRVHTSIAIRLPPSTRETRAAGRDATSGYWR